MSFAALIFSGWNWLWFAAGALLFGLILSAWSYRAAPAGPVRWSCFALKTLGIAALAFCLLEPLWSGQRARPGANLFALVADNSQSLQIKDPGQMRSRGEVLRELLDAQKADWQQTLEENFELRRHFFDARLQTTKDFSELAFDGRSSSLGAALRTLSERYRGRPLAGVLVLTDGNATDLKTVPDLAGLPPIYPVVLGSADAVKDIAIQEARVSQTAFEDAPVSVQADVNVAGYAGQSVVARLTDLSGKRVAEQTLRSRKDDETLPFRFQVRPEKPGLSFFQLNVRAASEAADSSTPGTQPSTLEATLANNSRVLVVNRGGGPYRILYVSGRPNWEFKFLNRALEDDDQLQLVGLIRVAKREPKFNFLGRAGETSNPLFRGFGNQSAEEVERYDQPVLVRLNTLPGGMELRGGFPRTPEELYAYHAVVIGDLEEEFFTPDQAVLLQKYVSERGGGFLMLGGMESFQEGKYQRTPIGDMLPVYVDRPIETNAAGVWHLNLTHEGWLQPWARLRDNEASEKTRLQSMAPFQVLNRVQDIKPGASAIATVSSEDGRVFPALVVQRFGRGRTAALTVGDIWRWGLHDAEAHHDMDKAWRQLMRWLVTDVPNRVDLNVETQTEDPNGAVILQVRARDPKFEPLDNATVSVQIEPVLSEASVTDSRSTNHASLLQLRAEPSPTEPGLYVATYVPRNTGGYKATAFVTNSIGAESGRAEAGWSTDLAADEFRSLKPNTALLDTIARKTGGQIIAADKLQDFARSLPHRHAPIMESWSFPLWHTPAMFGFALACFLAEWGLRRWKGLP
jgi:uncharacterized membrane protein